MMDHYPGDLLILTKDDVPIKVRGTRNVGYLLWDFNWDFAGVEINENLAAIFPGFLERPSLVFKIEKITEKHFTIEFSRDAEGYPLDDGCIYEFIITLFGYNGTLKRRVMDYATRSIKLYLNFSCVGKVQREGKYWVIKCIVKRHELYRINNDLRLKQEELLQKMLVENERYRDKFSDMAFLLGKESLTDIFSGRTDTNFALDKIDLIERTLPFADELAEKKRTGNAYTPSISVDVFLNYMLHGDFKEIGKYEVIYLYNLAYFYGLPYLAEECRDYMLANIDHEYLLHILMAADMAHDFPVMCRAIDIFIQNMKEVMKTKEWERLNKDDLLFTQNVIDAALRRLSQELRLDIERYIEDKMQKPARGAAAGEEPGQGAAAGEEPGQGAAAGEEPAQGSAAGEEGAEGSEN